MSKSKKHHYVPQLHLKHFANAKTSRGKKNYSVYFYDKKDDIKGKVNIKKAAMENYFHGKGESGQIIEDTMGRFETKVAPVYRDLISYKDHQILENIKSRVIISAFITIQHIRTLKSREEIRSTFKMAKEELFEQFDDDRSREVIEKYYPEEEVEEVHLSLINQKVLSDLTKILYDKKWILLENNTDFPFWTSDNPVARYNPLDLSPYGNLGVASWGIQIYFPLNTKLCLCLLDPERYRTYNNLEKVKFKDINQNIKNAEKSIIEDIDEIEFINGLQIIESYRQIFSKFDNFSLAKKMIKENPNMKNLENEIEVNFQKEFRPGSGLIHTRNIRK
ncbi:MAG: hypothetical protein CIT01_07150 [Methanobacterium sp. BRmetb2]|nr:MAG: hypothetical protein CIT01_07150 [Methanobacterium sp. BRmetb2]